MLERVAVHQTRLRVPGVGLDARGVALGARGLVLLPSLDRLIAFLAVYTGEQALDSLLASLKIEIVKSKLGAREVALSFDAGSSDRMDRVNEVARLTGGFVFTGTSRHFVQYRDASAPFGYDAPEITPTDAALALYHTTFSQVYDVERTVALSSLLMRLMPYPDPASLREGGALWLLAEPGTGASLLAYLARSDVASEVGIVEWPPETSFDDAPVRRWLFNVPELPARMLRTLPSTPGITAFRPAAPGAAVEIGYRHPITLRACPVFEENGLLLFRGRGAAPLVVERLPVLADTASLSRAAVQVEDAPLAGRGDAAAPALRVPLRLLPSVDAPTAIVATLIDNDDLPLFRRLVYALGPDAVQSTFIAVTSLGAFIHRDAGVEMLPVGTFFRRVHPSVFVPSGFDIVPAVRPDAVFAALGSPAGKRVFLLPDGRAVAVDEQAFAPLARALLEAERWAPLPAAELAADLAQEIPTVWLDALGMRPLSGAEPAT